LIRASKGGGRGRPSFQSPAARSPNIAQLQKETEERERQLKEQQEAEQQAMIAEEMRKAEEEAKHAAKHKNFLESFRFDQVPLPLIPSFCDLRLTIIFF